jgi:hypothetical protein
MRKFRIKEGARVHNGHEVGGVYELRMVEFGERTFSLFTPDRDDYWYYDLDDVEEVFEESTKSRKFKFLGDFSSVDEGTYAGFEIGKVYNYDGECLGKQSSKVSYYVDEYPDDWEEVIEESTPTYTATNTKDAVNPQHYKNGEVECIEAIKSAVVGKDGFAGYLVGNVIKYIWRFESKGGVTDLEKSNWYLNKLIDYEKNKER